jgi:hypothetical protein
MAQQMNNACLDLCLGKGRLDGLWEALEAVNYGDEDVLNAPVAQIVQHLCPELGALIGLKTVGGMAQTTLRGVERVCARFTLTMAANNLARLPKLLA